MSTLPKSIAFLLYNGIEEQDVVGPWEAFGLWRSDADGPPIFSVGESLSVVTCAHGLKMVPDFDFTSCPDFDALVVAGGSGRKAAMENGQLLSFLAQRGKQCVHLLSVCTGVFLLERAGLITNRRVTTHWEFLEKLEALGTVSVEEGVRYVRDGDVWSAAGISAGFDMAVAFAHSFSELSNSQGSQRTGDAGKIQLYAEYIPDSARYSSHVDLGKAPQHIRDYFGSSNE